MTINSTENKNLIIDQQNKLIDFLYKEQAQHVEQINEKNENMNIIYNMIAELYEYIQDGDYIENEYILEQLATMQNYAK